MLTWRDALDILAVATVFYYLYVLIAESRALNLVRGLLVYLLVWFVASRMGLNSLAWLLGNAATLGVFALIVVFQPELRGALERIGRGRLQRQPLADAQLNELVRAVERLSALRYGALIAIERHTPLGEFAATGENIDARLSARLLESLFFNKTPLHDGGAILRGDRVLAAGCVFPLSEKQEKYLGTRHKAAIGLSEVSDALVIVVSEERGTLRLADGGRLSPPLQPVELRERIREGLQIATPTLADARFRLWRPKEEREG
ncbi:diadenylate cyclase CdaA [Calidithermus chliarophilus]|uniref:diadenylate cyclase CdaA n=1 Tax=Calidithermus chliarophilus TaxID=52023 RepID=UPI000406D98F|nr:diadenylate cyclase CdaA [Calidithermus chliarophilus]